MMRDVTILVEVGASLEAEMSCLLVRIGLANIWIGLGLEFSQWVMSIKLDRLTDSIPLIPSCLN